MASWLWLSRYVGLPACLVSACLAANAAVGAEYDVSEAMRGADGILTHAVTSEFQAGRTEIRVLLPDDYDTSRRYRVLYVFAQNRRAQIT